MAPTLLLADDSITIQRVIELTFADEDVNIVAVSDGDEAIAVLERSLPDIVLADISMPGRSGYEVARHIRDTPRLAHIPVVLLTGAFEPVDRVKAAASGCDDVLAKPFEPQMVIGRVRELLSKPRTVSIDASRAPTPTADTSWAAEVPDPDLSIVRLGTEVDSNDGAAEAGDYFERLDRAFASLSAMAEGEKSGALPAPGGSSLDWFASPPPFDSELPEPTEPTLSREVGGDVIRPAVFDPDRSRTIAPIPDRRAPPAAAAAAVVPPSKEAPPPPVAVEPPQTIPASPPTLPPLAEAFAALLAAEQAAPALSAAPLWPARPTADPPADVSDEVIEKIVSRVLDRLGDPLVRDSVRERLGTIAERIVREEIDRIKSSVK